MDTVNTCNAKLLEEDTYENTANSQNLFYLNHSFYKKESNTFC